MHKSMEICFYPTATSTYVNHPSIDPSSTTILDRSQKSRLLGSSFVDDTILWQPSQFSVCFCSCVSVRLVCCTHILVVLYRMDRSDRL